MGTEPAKFLMKFYHIFKMAQSHVDVGKQTKVLAGTEGQSPTAQLHIFQAYGSAPGSELLCSSVSC